MNLPEIILECLKKYYINVICAYVIINKYIILIW